jgi:RNA polymerase sigma-70 factor (ECF subfamily)
MRNDQDAQDVVQESCMKALRAFDSLRGGDFRPWFLSIVRNTSFTTLRRNKGSQIAADEQSLEAGAEIAADGEAYDPQAIAIRAADAESVRRAIDMLPDVLRETLVLREMEGMSYKEIGKIAGVPIGTVMSRLARGRTQLKGYLMGMDRSGQNESAQEGAR